MMSSSVGNGERCQDGKGPSLSSPNRYELRSKGPLGSPLTQPKEGSPVPQPEEGNPLRKAKKRSGPRCKYPRHRIPPGMAPAYAYKDSYQDPENIPILEDERLLRSSKRFAESALSYLSQQGHHFELLSLDYYEGGVVGGGARFHHNFQAKPAHDPHAPPQTIFSQIFLRKDYALGVLKDLTVECCVSLGPSHSLPKKRDNRGCIYCSKYIHHPKDGCDGIIC